MVRRLRCRCLSISEGFTRAFLNLARSVSLDDVQPNNYFAVRRCDLAVIVSLCFASSAIVFSIICHSVLKSSCKLRPELQVVIAVWANRVFFWRIGKAIVRCSGGRFLFSYHVRLNYIARTNRVRF